MSADEKKKPKKKTLEERIEDAQKNLTNLITQQVKSEGKSDLARAVGRAVERGIKNANGESKITRGSVVKVLSDKLITKTGDVLTTDVDACISKLVELRPKCTIPEPKSKKE